MARTPENPIGLRFGRLTVIAVPDRYVGGERWTVRCDCGEVRHVVHWYLKSGNTKSCGCMRRDTSRQKLTTHGRTKSSEYRIWWEMRRRCEAPKNRAFSRYGGRGIRVCERWQKFENFFSDMGPRPSQKHSLDRINNNGNYEPGNCRWATMTEQCENRSSTRLITIDGRTQAMSAWAREVGIAPENFAGRIQRGDSGSALLRPPKRVGSIHKTTNPKE